MKFAFVLAALLLLSLNNDEWKASIERGESLYQEYCMVCHMGTGEGVGGVFPPLAGSDFLMADIERAIGVVKNGLGGEIVVNGETYIGFMPDPGLDDDEIADVLNFVLSSWGNATDTMITEERVSEL